MQLIARITHSHELLTRKKMRIGTREKSVYGT